ncbi:unnamed protein product [Amoebophrya sp. A120]|nr:unnamed protein product [Amoebophrya sp. A120]|eukprot:GSA120T00008479001.1
MIAQQQPPQPLQKNEQAGGSSPSKTPKSAGDATPTAAGGSSAAQTGGGAAASKKVDLTNFTDDKLRELIVKALERTKRAEKQIEQLKTELEESKKNAVAGGARTDATSKTAEEKQAEKAEALRKEAELLASLKKKQEEELKSILDEFLKKQSTEKAEFEARLKKLKQLKSSAEEDLKLQERAKKRRKLQKQVNLLVERERSGLEEEKAKEEEQLKVELAELEKEWEEKVRVLASSEDAAGNKEIQSGEQQTAAAAVLEALQDKLLSLQSEVDSLKKQKEALETELVEKQSGIATLEEEKKCKSAAGETEQSGPPAAPPPPPPPLHTTSSTDKKAEEKLNQLKTAINKLALTAEEISGATADSLLALSNEYADVLEQGLSISAAAAAAAETTTESTASTGTRSQPLDFESASVHSLEQKLQKVNDQLADQEEITATISDSNKELKDSLITSTSNEHKKLLAKHEQELTDTDTLLKQLELENLKLADQLKSIETNTHENKSKIFSELEEEMKEINRKRLLVEEEKRQLTAELSDLDEKKQNLKDTMSKLKEEMSASNQNLEQNQKEMNEMQESLQTVSMQIELTKQNLKSLQEEDRLDLEILQKECGDAEVVVEVDFESGLEPELERLIEEAKQGEESGASGAPKSPTRPPSGIKSPKQKTTTTWSYVYHSGRRKGYWVTQETLERSKMAAGDSDDKCKSAKPKMLTKRLHEDFESGFKKLQEEEKTAKEVTTKTNSEVDTLQAEFLQFRQTTATALQINSSLRTALEEQEKQQTRLRYDLELLEIEKEQEVKRKEENVDQQQHLLDEKSIKESEEQEQDRILEKLKFDIQNEEFQLHKATAKGGTGSSGSNGMISTELMDEEKKKREVTRLREDLIPPLELAVQALRGEVREQEERNYLAEEQFDSDFDGDDDLGSSAGRGEGLNEDMEDNNSNSAGHNSSIGDRQSMKTITDIRESGLYQNHTLLTNRKKKLLNRLPIQAYTLHPEQANSDISQLKQQVELLDKKLVDQRNKIQEQYSEIIENKKKFRQIQGLYLTPTKEMEYVQNVFRRFIATMPPDSQCKSLLPVMYKFFQIDPPQLQASVMGTAGGGGVAAQAQTAPSAAGAGGTAAAPNSGTTTATTTPVVSTVTSGEDVLMNSSGGGEAAKV